MSGVFLVLLDSVFDSMQCDYYADENHFCLLDNYIFILSFHETNYVYYYSIHKKITQTKYMRARNVSLIAKLIKLMT